MFEKMVESEQTALVAIDLTTTNTFLLTKKAPFPEPEALQL